MEKQGDGETQDGEEEAGDLDEEGVSRRGGDSLSQSRRVCT